MTIGRTVAALTAAFACAQASQAMADAVSDFYKGRTVEIIVGADAGGGYDANARLVGRHIGRFIPGNPNVLVTNMPGGGGITAANVLFNVSPKEGLTLGTFSNSMLTEPLLGHSAIKFDSSKFTWIGSATREDGICFTAKESGVASWDDLQTKEVIVGTTAPGTTTFVYPAMLRNLFGAKFKLVSGYRDGSSITLAFERGEVQAICQTYSSVHIARPDWFAKGQVNPILSVALERNADLPNTPSIMEIAKSDADKQLLKVVLAPTVAGRPLAAPPGVPTDRAEALRAAFMAMTKDEAFLADARKSRIDVEPVSGADIDALVRDIFASPKETIDKVKATVAPAEK
jgi:tripartite-type tricarboxylate transporter receptor subunit TctC